MRSTRFEARGLGGFPSLPWVSGLPGSLLCPHPRSSGDADDSANVASTGLWCSKGVAAGASSRTGYTRTQVIPGSRRVYPDPWHTLIPFTWDSAELKGPRKLRRIRPEIFAFEPDLGLTTPDDSGATVPTDRCTTILNDSGPMSACCDDDPRL